MNSFPGSKPDLAAENPGFRSPAFQPLEQKNPTDAASVQAVPQAPSTGSVLLAGLPPSAALHAKWLQARRLRETPGAKVHAEGHGIGQPHADDLLYFGVAARTSSRQQSSGDDASRGAPGKGRAPSATRFLAGGFEVSQLPATHIAGRALALPALCEAHVASQGLHAMPDFLVKTMQSLVIDFARDLADRIEQRASAGKTLRASDYRRPIAETCEEFLRLMRPLYQKYVPSPRLFGDAREVLCGAQPLLLQVMGARARYSDEIVRVLTSTIYPLFPIILMSAMLTCGGVQRENEAIT